MDEKSRSVSEKYNINNLAVRAFYYALTLSLTFELTSRIDHTFFQSNIESDIDSTFESTFDLMLDNLFIVALNRAMAGAVLDLHSELNNVLDHINNNDDNNEDLRNILCNLYDRLPHEDSTQDDLRIWRVNDGQSWVEKLRECTIYHHNIGHDFNLSLEQRRVLQQYYDSNVFLWECLNTDCYVDSNIRHHIEETLLLPS